MFCYAFNWTNNVILYFKLLNFKSWMIYNQKMTISVDRKNVLNINKKETQRDIVFDGMV
jgi:hypothetical protein